MAEVQSTNPHQQNGGKAEFQLIDGFKGETLVGRRFKHLVILGYGMAERHQKKGAESR